MSEKSATQQRSVHVTAIYSGERRLTLSPGTGNELFVIFGAGREVRHVEIVPMDGFLDAVRRLQEAGE